MNRLFKNVLFLSITSLLFMACNENDNDVNIYDGETYISFQAKTSGQVLENSTKPFQIKAYASIPVITEDFTVDFTVSSTDATSADYTVVGNKTTLNFGPGKHSDVIEIMPIDNIIAAEDLTITVTLSKASNGTAIGLPGVDAKATTFTLTLAEDDCPFTLTQLGEASWSGSDNVPAGNAGPNSSLITTSFDGTNLLIEGIGYAWITDTAYWNEPIVVSHKVIAQVDPVTGAIVIDEQPLCETTYLGVPQAAYSVAATGLYTSCSKTLVINYDIIQGGGVLRSYTDTLTF